MRSLMKSMALTAFELALSSSCNIPIQALVFVLMTRSHPNSLFDIIGPDVTCYIATGLLFQRFTTCQKQSLSTSSQIVVYAKVA